MKQEYKLKRLYHYTPFKSFCEIIKSNKFIFSDFIKANDYKEKSILLKNEIEKYKYISCTYDLELELYSYTNPPLWFFYADKGSGVCICFDKTKLLYKINAVKSGFVNYRNGVTHINNQTIVDYLMEKRKPWEYEKEYRILVSSDYDSVSNILDCILSIYIGSEVKEEEIKLISKEIPESVNIFQMYTDSIDGRYIYFDFRNKQKLKLSAKR